MKKDKFFKSYAFLSYEDRNKPIKSLYGTDFPKCLSAFNLELRTIGKKILKLQYRQDELLKEVDKHLKAE